MLAAALSDGKLAGKLNGPVASVQTTTLKLAYVTTAGKTMSELAIVLPSGWLTCAAQVSLAAAHC